MLKLLFPAWLLLIPAAFGALKKPAGKPAPPEGCRPAPIEVPKLPKAIPGFAELDRETGLHVTGAVQVIDFPNYRLKVTGAVAKPGLYDYDDLRCLPKVTASPALVCPGFFEDIAAWSGAPLAGILQAAQPLAQAKHVSLVSADGYAVTLTLEAALAPENFLAYEWEGQPLPVLHGFPLRAILPAQDGSAWVKWLVEIQVF